MKLFAQSSKLRDGDLLKVRISVPELSANLV